MFKQALIFRLHKVFSVIVGIQVLFWVLSGLYMTAVPISYVHGDHLRQDTKDSNLAMIETWVTPGEILTRMENTSVTDIKIFNRLGRATYVFNLDSQPLLFDAITAEPISPLTETDAINIATKAYTGTGNISSAKVITTYEQMPEIKGRPLPIWQVNFDDWVNTSLYVSNIEAEVITARSNIWRVFDFLWMLHIMDYDEREDFNNPLVIFMASLAMLLILTGIILLTKGFKRSGRRYLK